MAEHELSLIKSTLNVNRAKFSELFSKKLRPVLFIGLLLGIFQQFMGINTVMYYGPHIMKQIGFQIQLHRCLEPLVWGLLISYLLW